MPCFVVSPLLHPLGTALYGRSNRHSCPSRTQARRPSGLAWSVLCAIAIGALALSACHLGQVSGTQGFFSLPCSLWLQGGASCKAPEVHAFHPSTYSILILLLHRKGCIAVAERICSSRRRVRT